MLYVPKKISNEWKQKNKEYMSKYNKDYKEINREEISKYNKTYNIGNRVEIQKRSSKNYLKKLHEDINFKIAHCLRKRYRQLLKGNPKENSAIVILGCSCEFLKLWFIFCFEKDMTFENHGKIWHIDHTVPCSKFNLQDNVEVNKCFHWSNLKPMYAYDNIKKSNKLTIDEIVKHEDKLNLFLHNLTTQYNYTLLDINRFQYI